MYTRSHTCAVKYVNNQLHTLLCNWALYSGTQWRDLTWLFKAYCCCQIGCHSQQSGVSFSGRLRVTLGGQWVWYDRIRGRQDPLCVPTAPLSWSQHWANKLWVERPGRVRADLCVIVKDSNTLELRVTVGTIWRPEKSSWGSQRAEKDEKTPISLCTVYTTVLHPSRDIWIKIVLNGTCKWLL